MTMTTKQAPGVVRLHGEELAKLLTSVNETLATDVAFLQPSTGRKTFSHVQLWNLRRNARYIGTAVR